VSVVQSPQGPPKPSAAELLRSAEADKLGGKYELAVQEYIDYLKQYPDTPEADAALFQLAMTHYAMKDYESTVRECDALVEKYSESKRIPEALLYKSKSLQALGKGANARAVCADLRKRFAASEFAKQCPVAARQ
jgi:TolA-binding protein